MLHRYGRWKIGSLRRTYHCSPGNGPKPRTVPTAPTQSVSSLRQPKDYPQILWVFMIVEDLYFSPFGSHYQWSQDYHSLPNNRYGVPYLHLGLAYATRGGR